MTVLCIDDDPDDLDMLCEAVKIVNPKHRCVLMRTGMLGLKFLEENTPDVIFLDINMPMISGWELIKVIRAKEKFDSIPVYILSTTTNKSETEIYRKAGANDCLVKPSSFHELCEMMKNILNGK